MFYITDPILYEYTDVNVLITEMDPQEMKNFLIHVTKNSKVKEDSQVIDTLFINYLIFLR